MNRFTNTLTSGGRGLEYRAPLDSALDEPPRNSREIVYWMVLDGRRMQRHRSPFAALADKNARPKIVFSALVHLPLWLFASLVVIGLGVAGTLAAGVLAFAIFGSTTAMVIVAGGVVAATLAGLWFAASISARVCEPLLKSRGVSYDEDLAGMVAGLAPLALITLIAQVIV